MVLAVVRFQNPNEDIKLFLNYDIDGREDFQISLSPIPEFEN